jgi:N-acetylglucosamine-6-phosphate deacetylase
MIIKNARIIQGDKIVHGYVEINNGKIEKIQEGYCPVDGGIDANGNYLSPGFIDIHTHGIGGHDTMDDDSNSPEAMSLEVIKHGVTSLLMTTMSYNLEGIKKAIENVSETMQKGSQGATIEGLFLEGPFISPKAPGAHEIEKIKLPNIEDFNYMAGDNIKNIKMIIIAPEIEGASDVISCLAAKGIVVTAGHSAGTYNDLLKGINAGITHSTHLFNAMTGLHHREPGIVGGIFDTDITTEVIADGIHINFAVLRTVFKVKGPDKVALITDAMMAAGLKDGKYELGGQEVFVKDGAARLASGQLAGSTLTLDRAVCNVVKHCDVSITDAVKMASTTPAEIIGLKNKGLIKEGYAADLVIFDEDINIKHVYIAGEKRI